MKRSTLPMNVQKLLKDRADKREEKASGKKNRSGVKEGKRKKTKEEWAKHWKEVKAKKALTPLDLFVLAEKKKENRRIRMRAYLQTRRAFRKNHPAFAELDRVRYNDSRRRYMFNRRHTDPVFAEACRAANRESARRRRGLQKPITEEVDETA